jgi:hypothetical protein
VLSGLHFLTDATARLAKLSKAFQYDQVDMTAIQGLVESTQRGLEEDWFKAEGPCGPEGGFYATFEAGVEGQQPRAERAAQAARREQLKVWRQGQIAEIEARTREVLAAVERTGVDLGASEMQQAQVFLWQMDQHRRQVEQSVQEELDWLIPVRILFHGHVVGLGVGDEEASKAFVMDWARKVIENLKARFVEAPLAAAIGVLAPNAATFPHDRARLATYGGPALRLLFGHYGTEKVVDGTVFAPFLKYGFATLSDEIRTFKEWACTTFQGSSLRDTWSTIARNPTLLDQVPNLCRIAQVGMILFVSTACCERGFSRQILIKLKLRARMENDLLDNLIRIALVGPKRSEMDFGKAIGIWKSGVKRQRRMYANNDHLK